MKYIKTTIMGDSMDKILGNMGMRQLKEYLANRYPYLLIDKATEVIPGVSAKGYKNMTANEWFSRCIFLKIP